MKEALFYEKEGDRQVICGLCRFNCLIDDGKRGICAVRENRGGTLYSLVYGRVIATDTPERIKLNDEVRRAYLGEEV